MKNADKRFLLLACASLLAACTPTTAERGNILENYQIEEVVIGLHTRSDVMRLLGSPTTQAPFDDNTWYYIGQTTAKKGILDPEVLKERVVVVKFNDEGIVQTLEDLDTQRLAIPVERSKTPTHGNELTIMQQMLGNLGKFNAPAD